MSGRYSRNKGARAERELFALLGDDLGITIQRNLVQSRAGGCDSDADLPYAIEVKNVKALARPAWWHQACEQAEKAGKLPALFYRKPKGRGDDLRDAWFAVLPAPFAVPGCIVAAPPGHTITTGPMPTHHPLGLPMGYRAAVEVVREVLSRQKVSIDVRPPKTTGRPLGQYSGAEL